MKNLFLSAIVVFLFSYATINAQVGINNTTPNTKSVLDIVSKNNNTGVLFPRLTTAQRDAIAPSTTDPSIDGLLIYNTDNKCYEFWNRTAWVSTCSSTTPDVPPLSGVKLLSYEQDPTYTFATPVFIDFFNSFDNFGPFPSSTIQTDGSSLTPDKITYTSFPINFQNYNIIGVSYRPGIDLTPAEVTALVTFANTPNKHLYFFTEGFSQAQKLSLLNQLIGDITLIPADIVGTIGSNGDTNPAGPCYFLANDPLNSSFTNGPFGVLQSGTQRFIDHASSSNSFSYAKLSTSANIQIIAADGLLAGVPQPTSKVGVFKIKNKNVFVIADGAPFFGGTNNSGPSCMTPSAVGGTRGRKPLVCDPVSSNGTNSGVGILMANIIAWSLKHL
ncbi:hypothetical protein [Chryseobacterium viscerum]|uniref:Uncharacterized protein n=1 Tax=Chryseobacterium viscerum TaxID=1037377 RepID=A0A316WNV4_9FLAO|nr:hypothetical protein [Chryseobacterium viscerum]PWN62809.1 hypothetical protein C1634_008525 [Chryseobacterium viscerum]